MLDIIPLELADIIIQYTVQYPKGFSELTIENIKALYSLRLVSTEMCRRADFVFSYLLKKVRIVLYKPVTNKVLVNFTGGNCIDIHDCTLLTNEALVYFEGFQIVTLYGYTGITAEGIARFKFISPRTMITHLKLKRSPGTTIVRTNYIEELLRDARVPARVDFAVNTFEDYSKYLLYLTMPRQHRADLLYIKTILETPRQRKLNNKQRKLNDPYKQQAKKMKQQKVQKRNCSH